MEALHVATNDTNPEGFEDTVGIITTPHPQTFVHKWSYNI